MKKTNLKGMTLIEIVVSMAIYGLLALLIVEIMSVVNSTMRTTTQLNKRLAYEQRFADNRQTEDTLTDKLGALTGSSVNVTVSWPNTSTGGRSDVSSGAVQYPARYLNETTAVDYSEGINYKYLVFTPAAGSSATTFSLRIQFADGYPYDVVALKSPTYGDFTSSDGGKTWTNAAVTLPPRTASNGLISVDVEVYCDVRKDTNNTRMEIFDQDGNSKGWSDNYLYENLKLDYVTWVKNMSGEIVHVVETLTYTVKADRTVDSQPVVTYETPS